MDFQDDGPSGLVNNHPPDEMSKREGSLRCCKLKRIEIGVSQMKPQPN